MMHIESIILLVLTLTIVTVVSFSVLFLFCCYWIQKQDGRWEDDGNTRVFQDKSEDPRTNHGNGKILFTKGRSSEHTVVIV